VVQINASKKIVCLFEKFSITITMTITMEEELCPICLDPICTTDNVLYMPICAHKIHTKCELAAAQYDTRCPVCRTKDPDLTSKPEEEMQMFTNLEQLADEHDRFVRKYQRKRTRTINKHSKLGRIREKLKKERKAFNDVEKELEKKWVRLQKEMWNNNPDIKHLKNERKKYQRKTNCLCKKLESELEDKIGPKPDDITFHIESTQT